MTAGRVQYTAKLRAATLLAIAYSQLFVAASSYAQAPINKETTMAQLETLHFHAVPQAATAEIRPFHVNFSDEQLADLRRRIVATQWPERETVSDTTQGVQLATMQELARYWATDYDWRKVEARLNTLPQFITTIDGLDIHFIQVRSKNPNALPIIITHGWPGSIIEQLKVIGPLTDPIAYGGKVEDAFDVVIPSLPGYGFSGKPTAPGWNPPRIARAWATLMQRLGYTRYVAQGGDWGNAVTEFMAVQQSPGLIGIHTNMPATVPANVSKALAFQQAPPADLTPEERHAWDQLDFFYKNGLGYAIEMNNRPQTLYGIVDSPIGLLPAAGYAQTTRTADAQALVTGPLPEKQNATTQDDSIRPFHINIPDEQLVDLRQRLTATRWPDKETVNDESQGIRLAEMQALLHYWGNSYNWRTGEAKLNALPEFVTTIEGVDIQFIHVRSREPNALPLILTHGWPGSPIEFLKVIGPLTDPVAYGGRAEDAFDVVIPAIPGYGFSGKPTGLGWGPDRVARAWDVLMKRLGYTRYVSQGGDHGSVISDALARQAPSGLLAIHLTMPATIPADLVRGINSGDPAPSGLTVPEQRAYNALSTFFGRNAAYGAMMVTRPQTIGYALTDSPGALAAFTYEKIAEWSDSDGHPDRVIGRDEILDDITLYWLTGTGASSSRFYWENNNNNFSAAAQKTNQIKVPVAITVFPHEIYRAPESWSRQAYPSLYYFHEAAKGGHFAAWEQPELFSVEIRAAFRSLR